MSNRQSLPNAQAIEQYLKGFNFFEKYVQGQWEGNLYVETHSRRFAETLRMIPDLEPQARVLELGAIPYDLTILLRKFAGLNVDPLSFFEFETAALTTHILENSETNDRFEFDYTPVNVERDLFPAPDSSYDLVLCCELLEHLLINPSHMLYEVHRVLKPGGYLLLTTPNVLRWGNVFSLIKGRNINDSYHGNGIYGRHNREYSMDEVSQLLVANGFSIEQLCTRAVYEAETLNKIPLLGNRRDNIFALAKTVDGPRAAFPHNLYSLMDEFRNVVRPLMRMGLNEVGQIGRGWHDFEPGEPGFRWTRKEADFFLRNTEGRRTVRLRARSDHPGVAGGQVTIALEVNGAEAGNQRLPVHSWQDLTFVVEASEPILNCRVKVSETWVPKVETKSGDSRELGIGVSEIWLE
ncbi:MAG TPA: methyltransferase domain-containing protein [Pyrinomonadaceae bacterium]|nr:methyltransferase domain-containing protein [Pyrinomonadaceae bacterium]